MDYLLVMPFTREFAQWTSEEYVQELLLKTVGTKHLVIGYDHRFGKNREGGFDYLSQHAERYGFTVEEIPRQDVDAVGVSSTRIRRALRAGDSGHRQRLPGLSLPPHRARWCRASSWAAPSATPRPTCKCPSR
ncbi:MAG: hypothetical protein WKG07_09785 [Hymenobacter sp.]